MKANSFWLLLINPFTRIGGWKASFIGLAILLVATLVAYLGNVIPVGLFSVKPMDDVSLSTILTCQLSVLVTLVLVVYIVALISTKYVRFQDVFGVIALSQVPLLPLIAIAPSLKTLTDSVLDYMKTGDASILNQLQSISSNIFIIFVVILTVAILIWYFVLLYNGFKTLTDLKGAKSIIIFIVVVVLSDVLSVFLISLLTNGAVNRFAIF